MCILHVCEIFEPAESEVIDNQQPLYGAAERAFPQSAKNVRRDFLSQTQASTFSPLHTLSPFFHHIRATRNKHLSVTTRPSRHQQTALPRLRLATLPKNAQTEIPETPQKGFVSKP